MTPRNWKKLERHTLSAEYDDISGKHWEKFVAGVREFGVVDRKIILFDGKVIDGWQLHRACVEANKKPKYANLKLPKGMDVERWVEIKNDHRRHEAMEVMLVRAEARRERVAKAIAEGKSLSAIADQENVSLVTIRRDAGRAPGARAKRKKHGENKEESVENDQKPGLGLPGPQIPDRFKTRGLVQQVSTSAPPPNTARAPKPAAEDKGGSIVYAVHKIYETLQQALEDSEAVFKAELVKQQKKLSAVQADIDALLGKAKPDRGAVWDAIVEVTKSDNTGHIGKAVKTLLSKDPPYSPEEIRRLPPIIKRTWPNVLVTVGVVEKYAYLVRAEAAGTKLSPKDAAEFNRLERQKAGIE